MFGNNVKTPKKLLSYADALARYESIKPIRGRSDQNTRPLARRTNDNLTIRMGADDELIVQLYYTDIVTYDTGGTITIKPYPSVVTNRVMDSLLYPCIRTCWSRREYPLPENITQVAGRWYHTPWVFTVSKDFQLQTGSVPFEVPLLDRRKTTAALKECRYYDFALWLKTQDRLGLEPLKGDTWRRSPADHDASTVGRLLRYPTTEGWAELARRMSPTAGLEAELGAVRKAVYRYADCYEVESVPYFEAQQALQTALRRMKGHG